MAKKFDLKLKGYVGGWDFDTDYVDYVLDKAGDNEVSVLIDSLGGSVATALSVSSAFANHGKVNVYYRGMNASAATIASMGAKHVAIEASAMYLVHKCSSIVFEWAALNADELIQKAEEYKKTASDLEKIDMTIATMYAQRCKKSVADLMDLMKENKWLTAQEALEWGFVDEVVDSTEDVHLTQSVATAMAAAGIPLPENMSVEADGFMAQMERLFSKWFGKKKEEAVAAAAEPTPKKDNQQTQSIMKKSFLMLAAVLAAANLSELTANEEGKFVADEAQMDAIEASLAAQKAAQDALEAKKAELESQLAAANATIDALNAKPAKPADQVVDTTAGGENEPENPAEKMQANIAEARRMLGKE